MPDPLRNTDDQRRYANALRLASEKRMEALSQRLADGEITLQDWQLAMREELRRTALEQFVVGKGGAMPETLNPADYLALGPALRQQYKYLARFATAIDAASQQGKSLQFVVQRSKLYARSSQAVFWQSAIPVTLPQYPRDGGTACKSNCKCRLRHQYENDADGNPVAVLVYWKLSAAEHCEDCLALARSWNPLRVPLSEGVQESNLQQGIAIMLQESPELRPMVADIYYMYGIEVTR